MEQVILNITTVLLIRQQIFPNWFLGVGLSDKELIFAARQAI
jgi:hypothetical protein